MKFVVGYIPEHFSAPVFLAEKHGFFRKHGVDVVFKPFPSGTGHLIQSLKDEEINVAIGLTEAFIRGIAGGSEFYKLVGVYVQSPLCWAISTGANRDELTSDRDLRGATIGVSRMGSGSDVMSRVFLQEKKWTEPFKYAVNNDFKNLRDGVNHKGSAKPSDAFMWEYFTSKKYYDNGEIKRIGEIYTPWPSWVVVARTEVIEQKNALVEFLAAVDEGVAYFNAHPDDAIDWIISNLDYSEEDARGWLKTVKFNDSVAGVDPQIVRKTVSVLKTAANLDDDVEELTYVATLD